MFCTSQKKKKIGLWPSLMNSFLSEDEPGGDSADTSAILAKKFPDILINESFFKGDDGMLEFAKINQETIRNLRYSTDERWAQQENRKPRGYWPCLFCLLKKWIIVFVSA